MDNINYDAWRFWIMIFQTLISVGLAVYVWMITRDRVTNQRISKLEKDLAERCEKHHSRTANLEINMERLPSKAEISALTFKIDRLGEKLATVDGRLIGVNRAVDLMNQHHLKD